MQQIEPPAEVEPATIPPPKSVPPPLPRTSAPPPLPRSAPPAAKPVVPAPKPPAPKAPPVPTVPAPPAATAVPAKSSVPRPARVSVNKPGVDYPAAPQPTQAHPPSPSLRQQATAAPAARKADAYDAMVGKLIDGRYRITAMLARGGMGVVFDAFHELLGRRVALKALTRSTAEDPAAIQRFKNEARIVSSLGHPSIVEVYDFGTFSDGAPYLVMEFLEGETLAQRLKRERMLTIGHAVEIATQVLSALSATHAKGIIHRDLKPENVFLVRVPGATPRVKLLDFGISKHMLEKRKSAEFEDEPTLTRAGFVMGTPAYMAYEQARGLRDLDARVDLYAVGVLLYEMLVGRLPFTSKYPAGLVEEMIKSPPLLPRKLRPEIPESIENAVLTLLQWDRTKRYANALTALGALTGGTGKATDGEDDHDPTVVTGVPADFLAKLPRSPPKPVVSSPSPPARKPAPALPADPSAPEERADSQEIQVFSRPVRR